MKKIHTNEAMKELTMILLYLSRFKENDSIEFPDAEVYYAWKGFDFSILNELEEDNFIRQGKHPSRSKSVYLTEAGIEQAKTLMEKYHIDD